MGKRKGQINKMNKSLLVKDMSKKHGHRKGASDSFLHTTELDDGTTYNRINFQSVTEQNNLEDFLNTAEMAGKDFTAERQNIQIITSSGEGARLTAADLRMISQAQDENKGLLQIPRRPKWDESTTKENLVMMERDSFTDWRRQLKVLEEKEHIQLTPYEKNLDFWRQLWRVIERSDVIVQIVDARNPLLFYCEDLETYVKEVDPMKTVLLLINKADFLTLQQRQTWVEYFNREGIQAVFFSAKVEKERQEGSEAGSSDLDTEEEEESDDDTDSNSDDDAENSEKEDVDEDEINCVESEMNVSNDPVSASSECNSVADGNSSSVASGNIPDVAFSNNAKIISAEELLDVFRKLAHPASSARSDDVKTVGMVGYPNVGKSSTINVILKEKRLAVSATPGRTKHLQTLYVDQHLILCDCPGLVFPSFVATKAHLVINGILPIDEMRDHVSPVTLVCERIPRNVLEATYSIMIPRPSLDDNPDRIPTAEELLNAYGGMRGFMTARGVPDGPRASRYILKDFVKGRLLYCEPPPGVNAEEFQDMERVSVLEGLRPVSRVPPPQIRSNVDKEFFAQKNVKIHHRGNGGLSEIVGSSSLRQYLNPVKEDSVSTTPVSEIPVSEIPGSEIPACGTSACETSASDVDDLDSMNPTNGKKDKPWRKHNNKNKREKLRRLFRHLDI